MADIVMADIAMADVAMVDVAMADIAMVDVAMADIAMVNVAMADIAMVDVAMADIVMTTPRTRCHPWCRHQHRRWHVSSQSTVSRSVISWQPANSQSTASQ